MNIGNHKLVLVNSVSDSKKTDTGTDISMLSKIIKNKKEAYRVLRTLFSNQNLRAEKGQICAEYVKANIGATQKILQEIYRIL